MPLSSIRPSTRKQLRIWLMICMGMVAAMVWVGGMTRLTESGLSMVEWKPLHILPPMNDAQWQEEFSKYQQYPEYQKINRTMDVDGFKHIFWLEYLHRLLGRSVGLVFFLPLVYFAFVARIPRTFSLQLLAIFALGGLQGLIGWIMVRSGLQDNPWVNPVKLALHLGMAFALFALIFWQVLRLGNVNMPQAGGTAMSPQSGSPCESQESFTGQYNLAYRATIAVAALTFIQILLGALVAGRDAGLIYNTYPTMNGEWIPEGLHQLSPWWHNAVENITAIQFNHRLGAHLIAALVLSLFFALRQRVHALHASKALWLLPIAVLIQFGLGVWTLLAQVPVSLGSAHQMGALFLWGTLVALLYRVAQLRVTRKSLLGLTKVNDRDA